MAIPRIRLEYLPFRAMAETTRFCLRHGGIPYEDNVVWGRTFAQRRQQGRYPFDKVPVIHVGERPAVAQSGTMARLAAKLAGLYPLDPVLCAESDAVFELAQEMCTINPLINCYTGSDFQRIHNAYFRQLPAQLEQLERMLHRTTAATPGASPHFFGGTAPSHADFNAFHHLDNATTAEPDCVESDDLLEWMGRMRALPALGAYLDERPQVSNRGAARTRVKQGGDIRWWVSRRSLLRRMHRGRACGPSARAAQQTKPAGLAAVHPELDVGRLSRVLQPVPRAAGPTLGVATACWSHARPRAGCVLNTRALIVRRPRADGCCPAARGHRVRPWAPRPQRAVPLSARPGGMRVDSRRGL